MQTARSYRRKAEPVARYDPNAISVPAAFARAVVEWKTQSFERTSDDVRTNLTGRLMNRQTGKTLANVEQNSKLTEFGFKLATSMPSLIAWMLGSNRKAYTVVPVRKKVLSWFVRGQGRVFARRVHIPAWKFTPVRPVLQDAIDRNKTFMEKLLENKILTALSELFPDVRIEWRI